MPSWGKISKKNAGYEKACQVWRDVHVFPVDCISKALLSWWDEGRIRSDCCCTA